MLRHALLLVSVVAFAQTAPTFEVASIKPAPPFSPGHRPSFLGVKTDAARADFGGMSLESLIGYAYKVMPYQISGPDYLKSERFDIQAKFPDGASRDDAPAMMQALLADRFKLVLHKDSKEFQVYALLAGKGGAKLTAKPDNYEREPNSPRMPMSMPGLASLLSSFALEFPIVDQTELKGEYLISTESITQLLMNRARARMEQSAARNGGSTEASDPGESSGVFGLVQQYGLKLEKRKVPLPYLIIEHVEKAPTEN